VAPPVPIPNTEVKRCSPDGSTATGRARVGRRQSKNPGEFISSGFFFASYYPTRGRRPKRTEPRERARWMVKLAATTEQTGGCESSGILLCRVVCSKHGTAECQVPKRTKLTGVERDKRETREVSERERTNQYDVARTKCPVFNSIGHFNFWKCHARPASASMVFHSSGLSSIFRAAIFSSKCGSDEVPGIGSITGDRCSSHASPS
jgi:hypothetical protein